MIFDAPNPEEVGKEDGLELYDKLWGASASHISISMPQTFRMGYFLESLIFKQDRDMEILKNMCANVAADINWADKGPPHNKYFCGRLGGAGVGKFS